MYGMFCAGCRIQESGMSRFFNFKFVSASHFVRKKVAWMYRSNQRARNLRGSKAVFVEFL